MSTTAHLNPEKTVRLLATETIIGAGFTASIQRSTRRRSVAIKVLQGGVVIMAPQRLSIQRLQSMVDGKSDWIRTKLEQQSRFPAAKPKHYIEGDIFTYRGADYSLRLINNPLPLVVLTDTDIIVSTYRIRHSDTVTGIKRRLETWYRQQAQTVIAERVAHYAQQMDVRPASIATRTYKSRWGSCNTRGDLSFNWKLIIAPSEILDYVVVHELAHIRQHNHSPAFWHEVACILPEFKAAKLWLKQHGHQLVI